MKQDLLLKVHAYFSKHILNLNDRERGVICNGRVIGPLNEEEEFTTEDFSLLDRFSQSSYGDKLFKYLLNSQFLEDDEYGRYMFINKCYFYWILFYFINFYRKKWIDW